MPRRRFGIDEAWAAFCATRPEARHWTFGRFQRAAKKWSAKHYIVPLGPYGRSGFQRDSNAEVWIICRKGEISVLLASMHIEFKKIEIDRAVYAELLSRRE